MAYAGKTSIDGGIFITEEPGRQPASSYQRLIKLSQLGRNSVRKGIHPEYKKCIVSCACGNVFETRSTVETMRLDICSECHPFYTGKQKLVDTAGRVEQFMRKFEKSQAMQENAARKLADKRKASTAATKSAESPPKSPAGQT